MELLKSDDTLIELPAADLEARLVRLQKLLQAQKNPPRLLKAVYSAELMGDNLTSGGAQWLVEHSNDVPGVLQLPSFNLAVSKATLNGQEAMLGDLAGTTLGLWIPSEGLHTVVFDWTVRGIPGVQGVQFDLRLPACPMTSLEIKLPADQTPSVPKGSGLLTGPFETESGRWRRWRLQVAGRTQIELLVRRGSEPNRPPLVLAARDTVVRFTPELTYFDTDLQVEVLHSSISELVFEIDGDLTPYDVTTRQMPLQSWKVEPLPANPEDKSSRPRSLLRVQLREPLLGLLSGLRIRSSAPRWPEQETSLPSLVLARAIHRGENLRLELNAEQNLERWDAGSFRIVQASTDGDGAQTLKLVDTHPEGSGVRPRFLLRVQSSEFAVTQDTRWHLGTGGITLTTEVQYDVVRGRLHELQVRLPKQGPWEVAAVDLQPREALQKWGVIGDLFHLDLQRGITPRSDLKLTLKLQSAREPVLGKARLLDFPDIEPLGARLRQGSLAIFADAPYQVLLLQSSQPHSRPDASVARDPRLHYFFGFRQGPVTGKLRLLPQRPVLQVRTQQKALVFPLLTRVEAQLTLEPIVGQSSFVDVLLTEAWEPCRIDVKGAELRARDRLHAVEVASWLSQLGAGSPLARVLTETMIPRGQVWRLYFREPISKPVTVTVRHDLPRPERPIPSLIPPPMLVLDHGLGAVIGTILSRSEEERNIPVAQVPGAELVEGELSVQPVGMILGKIRARGLEASTSAGAAPSGRFTREFRFRQSVGGEGAALSVGASLRFAAEFAQTVLDEAELMTAVDKTGDLIHHVRARVWNWQGGDFLVLLPPESRVIAARLDRQDFDRVTRGQRPEGLEVAVPMGTSSTAQLVELSYTTPASSWFASLGQRISLQEPRFPIAPLLWRRSIQLDSEWMPLHQDRYDSLDRRTPGRDSFGRLWRFGEEVVEEILPRNPPAWLKAQSLGLRDAEANMRRANVREMSLAEAVSRILFDSKEPIPLVLDRDALRTMGISPRTVVKPNPESSTPFWEQLGLVHVPTPAAALLTNRERATRWMSAIDAGGLAGGVVAQGVDQALKFGQDGSGRFCAADRWLRTEPRDPPPLFVRESADASRKITWWHPLVHEGPDDSLVILHRGRVRWAGIFGAIATLAAGCLIQHWLSPSFFFRAIWLTLAGFVLGVVAAPLSLRELFLGPAASLSLLLALSYRRFRVVLPATTARSGKSTQKAIRATLGSLMVVAFGAMSMTHLTGQEAMDRVVYLLTDKAGKSPRAFLRPETLRWIEDSERLARPTRADVVFLASRYRGRWDGEVAHFQAEFEVHAFEAKTDLIVPLTSVDLEEGSFVDGTPVFPVVAPARPGYVIPLRGEGRHRVTLSFSVRPIGPGDVKFGVPSAVDARLTWNQSFKLGAPQGLRGQGAETVIQDTQRKEYVLEAQLGREPFVHVHWASSSAPEAPGKLQLRELYLWDLRPGYRSGTALLGYVPTGEVRQVEILIPSSLEVRSVDCEDSGGQGNVGLKAWRMQTRGSTRVLQVDFTRSVAGPFQLSLALVPRGSSSADAFELALPYPLRATSVESLLGFRMDEAESQEKAVSLGVTSIAPKTFVEEWKDLSRREMPPPARAFSFVRSAKSAAAAALEVTPLPGRPRLDTVVEWNVQPTALDMIARLTVRSPEDHHLLSIRMPANVLLRDVQADDLHHWSRFGDTVQVWLTGPRNQTTLSLFGLVKLPNPTVKQVALPIPTVLSAVADSTALVLGSTTGKVLEPKNPAGWSEDAAEDGRRRLRPRTGQSGGDFLLQPRTELPLVQSLTVAAMQGESCNVTTHVHARLDVGEYPDLHLRVRGWSSLPPRLLFPGVPHKSKYLKAGADHVWALSFPAGTPQQVAFTLKGRVPVRAGQAIPVPEIHIDRGGRLVGTSVALLGAQVPEKVGPSWTTVRQPARDLSAWPQEVARLRASQAVFLRMVGTEATTLLIQPRETPSTPPAKVLDTRHVIVAAGTTGWLHRMSWQVLARPNQEVEVRLPTGAQLGAVFVNGQVASPRLTGSQVLALSLPTSSAPIRVEVSWTYSADQETLAQPRLTSATLPDILPETIHGTLYVPSGWNVGRPNWITPLAGGLLARARIDSQAFQTLKDGPTPASKSELRAQQRPLQSSVALLKHAEYRIRLAHSSGVHADLVEVAWKPELTRLQEEHRQLVKSLGVESLRQAADQRPWSVSLTSAEPVDVGIPVIWVQAPGTSEPTVDLEPQEVMVQRRLWERVSIGLILFLVVFLLSFSRWGLRGWISLWPEQVAALILLVTWVHGFSLVAAILVLGLLFVRLFTLIRGVRYLTRRRPAAASTMSRHVTP